MTGSQMMIHPAWGMATGHAAEMRDYADVLDFQTEAIAGIYAEHSHRSAKHFRGLLDQGETWLTPQDAVELGLADEVTQPVRESATIEDNSSAQGEAINNTWDAEFAASLETELV